MIVVFHDLLTNQRFEVTDVLTLKRCKIVSHGRKQWCYVCVRQYFTVTYPCKTYDLLSCAIEG